MRFVADIGMSICVEASLGLVIGICMPGMSECCGWAQIEKDEMRASTIEARRNMVDPFSEVAVRQAADEEHAAVRRDSDGIRYGGQ
jgi:hypothetical protein